MGNANIMIVEDNRIVAEDLKNKLVRMNYTVSAIATSGKKALAAAASLPPDLVLMDIQLGAGMNGIDTAAQLRRDYQTPIIYLTAYADEDTIDRAKATEPYGYIVKPYDDKDLKSAIEIALYKQASERKLIESHQWLHTTLKSIGDGVIATDVDGKVVFINPLAARLTGWPEEDVVGRPMPEVFRIINEDDRREQEDPVARVLREGDVLGMAKDTLLVSRDGTEIPIADSGAPIRDDKGQIIGVVLVFRDQTRERQAQKALLQSEARLNEAQRVAKIGDFKLDIETGAFVLSDNMYRLLGYDPGEPIDDGRINPQTIQHPEDHSRIAAWLDTCIASGCGELTPNTYRLIRKNGDILHVRSVGVIHRAPTGSHIVFGTVQDITEQIQAKREQERLQTQLLNAQKMEAIGTLAGGIAHDFNNILTSILGFTELAMEDTKANPLVLEHLNEIFSAGKRAKQLVRQILAFARQADDACRPIRIDTIVKEVLKLLRSSIPVSIDIKQHINSDAMVMGNAIQVYQIMMNLCANAAQAMEDEGGRLEVSLSNTSFNDARARHLNLKSGDYVKLKVSDTGPGIAPEIIDTIFDPYFTTKGPGEGTGMGLAVVHGIVQNYGGTIRADSKPKKGTVFTVYLPAVKGHDISAPPMLEKAPAGIEHILLIDDELPIIKAASEILKRLGYTVTTRSSSPAALELFRSTPGKFDLVITDMTMPDMTGDRLAAELLSIRSNIPVILCTGYSKKMTKERAAEIGIKAFLNKPITRSSLALTVRHVLDQS